MDFNVPGYCKKHRQGTQFKYANGRLCELIVVSSPHPECRSHLRHRTRVVWHSTSYVTSLTFSCPSPAPALQPVSHPVYYVTQYVIQYHSRRSRLVCTERYSENASHALKYTATHPQIYGDPPGNKPQPTPPPSNARWLPIVGRARVLDAEITRQKLILSFTYKECPKSDSFVSQ